MRNLPFILSTSTSLLCVILGAWLFYVGSGNREFGSELQTLQRQSMDQQGVNQEIERQLREQQDAINAGTQISTQVGPELLRDLAVASTKNTRMEDLLAKHGYTVKVAEDGAGPTSTPEP